ncbi:MAG: LysM peptidoglycan-binding domain-containing protein [Bacillota bacterium]|nr:LysM peptidoglycan-binding domain-containing protein [Bacillota bacterium]
MILFNKYKVTNMFRFKLFIILSLVIILIFTLYNFTAFSINKEEHQYIEILVHDGDTIWDIAQEYYDGAKDIRRIVHDILNVNGIEGAMIKPGDKILIPVSD